jgi:hypothetical protein
MAAVIKQQEIDGEQALNLGFAVLVASKSEPGAWYEVRDGRCTCKGYQYRGKCRHLAVAAQALQEPELPRCKRCGQPSAQLRAGLCPTCLVSLD